MKYTIAHINNLKNNEWITKLYSQWWILHVFRPYLDKQDVHSDQMHVSALRKVKKSESRPKVEYIRRSDDSCGREIQSILRSSL